ncbi:MAG: FprA family A-type flavoprotein [Clostridiales bacterium]|nr:FprA family A-type flavoprotein [Clostridiales bacterium]
MQSYNIDEGLYWVGAQDPDLRVFDVIMSTQYGTSYNSYFVRGRGACAVVEGVKAGFFGEWKERLTDAGADPSRIDYLVLNHTEPDHTGAVRELLELSPETCIVCSRAASLLIREIVNEPLNLRVVGDGDSIDLGGVTLRFVSAPFLHWPDSMFTYIPERRALISGDVFGFHHHWPGVFEDAMPVSELLETQKYYFDVIMSPFKKHVLEACEKVRGLDISVICPSHGPVLNKDPLGAVARYEKWAAPGAHRGKSAFVGYVSCYGFTAKLARAIAAELESEGVDVRVQDVSLIPALEAAAMAMAADAVIIGSPTVNRDALEPVWQVMGALSAIVCRSKVGASFGSYGWSGEAAKHILGRMEQLGMKTAGACRAKMNPNEEELGAARTLAKDVAAALNA